MKIIGLCGYARVGKDTAADSLPGFTKFAFAESLKADVQHLLGMVGCDLDDASHKEQSRPLLVAWGSVARKFRPDFWIERLFRKMEMKSILSNFQNVVISDCRYKNEIDAIESRGGKVVMIGRPGYGPANAEEERSFSEIYEAKNLVRVVNDSTPEMLAIKIMEAANV